MRVVQRRFRLKMRLQMPQVKLRLVWDDPKDIMKLEMNEKWGWFSYLRGESQSQCIECG